MQLQANVTGDLRDMEHARTAERIAAGAVSEGLPPVAGNESERELGVFLEYQSSKVGQLHQAKVTAATKLLALFVGGHHSGEGTHIASVYERLMRMVAPRPGIWLMRKLMSDERLADVPGVHSRGPPERAAGRAVMGRLATR